jgi:hypothetical protein
MERYLQAKQGPGSGNNRNLRASGKLPAVILGVVLLGLCHGLPSLAQEDAKTLPLNTLSLEVEALQTLHQFNFTKTQLEKLQPMAVGTAAKDQKRKAGKASKGFREKLQTLRKALMDAKDDERISKLGDELDALRDKEKPVLDDHVDITEAAGKRTAEAFRLLRPSQLAFYIAHIADNIDDPLDHLIESLDDARAMTEEEWKEQRDEIAEDVSRLAVGLDPVKSKAMSDQIGSLLARAHKLTKFDFQKQQPDLTKAARNIIGDISAVDVLRHQVEVDLATLLSNPRLPQALRARLAVEQK